jgi:cbb3-type cytochrome oxidase subunit 3
MNILFLFLILSICVIYIKLCTITKYESDNEKLSDDEKKLLLITNSIGYILSILLITIESMYLSVHFSTNIPFRLIQLIIVLLLIIIAYYSHIFRENEHDFLCKIASGLWPLMSGLTVIAIICLNTLYTYLNNISPNLIEFQNDIISKFHKY